MDKMGVLPSAPLFYVLASIRFSALLRLPEFIPVIQDALRERLPLFYQLTFEVFNVGPTGQSGQPPRIEGTKSPAWAFMAADRSAGCQISSDQILVHTRHYVRFADFAQLLRSVVAEVEKQVRNFDVNAVGIRYLDHVSPIDGEELAAYLKPAFLAVPSETSDLELLGGLSHRLYKTDTGVLQTRLWYGSGYTMVPDDLQPLYLLTEDQSIPRSPKLLESGCGILDIDSIWSSSEPERMNTTDVVAKLDVLHGHANAFFRDEAFSDHAFEQWNKDPV